MSAARHHGLWTPDDTVLHVGRPAHAGRMFGDPTGVVQHWQSPSWTTSEPPIETISTLIRQLLLCCDREQAIAVIDSALNQRKLTAAALKRILMTLPQRFASILGEVDAASESGLESLCRVRLRNIGTGIRSQVNIGGVGRVDLLLGDRLVIEADGQAWHDGRESFHVDRSRDLGLHRLGYIVIRVSYAHVMFEWMLVELAIRAIIGRREHLWSAAHRREGLAG
jgi:very-short-patch-repair endonuclease